MAARKLQIEIDRTVKKISEGIEVVESVFEKLSSATNQQLKEKYEADLKKEIKKLQRYRDQIKTWAAMNEIKDKRVLLENRRLIEMQMEKFKATERELKTKAYSQAGLNAASKVDPEEKERDELRTWISDMSDKLATQIDMHEAELESQQQPTSGRKGKRAADAAKSERLLKIERKIERHKHHQKMLDIVLRMLDNGKLTTDEVNNIKEDVNYYVDFNQDEEFNEDEGIYDHLNLQDAEEYGFGNDGSEDEDADSDDSPPPPPKEKESHSKRNSKSERDHEPPTPVKTKTAAISKPPKEETPVKAVAKTAPAQTRSSASSRTNNMIPAPADPPAPLPQRYAAAAAASAAAGGSMNSLPSASASTSGLASATGSATSVTDGKPSARNSVDSATGLPSKTARSSTSSASGPQSVQESSTSLAGAAAEASTTNATSNRSSTSQQATNSQTSNALPPLPPQQIKTPKKQQQQLHIASTPATQISSDSQSQPPHSLSQQQSTQDAEIHEAAVAQPPSLPSPPPAPTEALESRLPPTLADLLPSFESIRDKSLMSSADPASAKMVDASYEFRTQAADSAKPRTYIPRNPYPVPGYYPQAPLATLDTTPQLFERFDIDTLFFVFYFQPGTFQQYLAARELKRQSWRFHKQYLTWFQRHEDPKAITEDYENGTYIYFDYEDAWCQRKKSDFRFEYKYLEDEV